MILLTFSHSSRKYIRLTYLKITVCEPNHGLKNQLILCSFECLYLHNSNKDVPLLKRART